MSVCRIYNPAEQNVNSDGLKKVIRAFFSLLYAQNRGGFENNPFEAVRSQSDLNGLQKIREMLALDRADEEREEINTQAVTILKDPRILEAAVEANRRVLTPLWFELIEEGRRDGSIRTEYAKELSELLPLINFWLMPSVFPADAEEIRHK